MPSVHALIPCAGRGTRLLPVSASVDKSLFPFARRTILDWVLDSVSRSGVSRATVALPSSGHTLVPRHELIAASHGVELAFVSQRSSEGDFASGVLAAWRAAPVCEAYLVSSPDAPAIADGQAIDFADMLSDVLGGAEARVLASPVRDMDPVQLKLQLRNNLGAEHKEHVSVRHHWAVSHRFLVSLDDSRQQDSTVRLLDHAARLIQEGHDVAPRLLGPGEICEDLGTWESYERAFVRMAG